MAGPALLYYITDRTYFSGDEAERRRKLLAKISEAAACGVDFIQLREKDLSTRELERLAYQALEAIGHREPGNQKPETRLLINSRSDLALAVGADGVHLRSQDISPSDARNIRRISKDQNLKEGIWIVAVSCHSEAEVLLAAAEAADFVVLAPVFAKAAGEKNYGSTPTGLEALRRACRHRVPVLALGGVTMENARSCFDTGAAGIAGIRIFQENDISEVVRRVRG